TVAAALAPGTAASAGGLATAPDVSTRVVDLNRQPDAENTGQVCRQMLKPNTNSIITVCGTPAQWKRYEQAEAQRAEELVLRMQRGEHCPRRAVPMTNMLRDVARRRASAV